MLKYYKFIIKDEKFIGYKKIASLLFIINGIAFTALGIASNSISNKLILFTGAFILLSYALYHWKYKKKKEKSYITIYLLIAIIWIAETPFYYFSILFFILLLLQYRMENEALLSFSTSGIKINTFIERDYQWSDFNNIILKDGLLTLDFVSNKIIQVEPDWSEPLLFAIYKDDDLDAYQDIVGEDYQKLEKEFNDFCKSHLETINLKK